MGDSIKKETAAKKSVVKKKSVKKTAPVSDSLKKTASAKNASTGGLKKQYLKAKNVCRVTFTLPQNAVPLAEKVNLVGDFNDWNPSTNQMKKSKDGYFTATLDLAPGREYQFKYLTDDSRWENDPKADKYVPSPFGSTNSVIVL